LRSLPLVPVVLGPTLPRADREVEERQLWCRAMLILFKPWRSVADLKGADESWQEAYDKYEFPRRLRRVIENINVEHECKDARDQYDNERREGRTNTH
ncbi:hypothetical protein BV25DRAFT_1777328, partial [Artomyces pyxidatus]